MLQLRWPFLEGRAGQAWARVQLLKAGTRVRWVRPLGGQKKGGARSEGPASAPSTCRCVISAGHFTPDASHLENCHIVVLPSRYYQYAKDNAREELRTGSALHKYLVKASCDCYYRFCASKLFLHSRLQRVTFRS